MRPRRQTSRSAVAAALAIITLTACSPATKAAEPTASAGEGSPGSASRIVVDEDSALSRTEAMRLDEPIATVEAPAKVEGDPGATMTIDLRSLQRQGEVVVAVYSFTVHSSSGSQQPKVLSGYLNGRWDPQLFDTTNLNRHEALASAGGGSAAPFAPGDAYYGYAVFAAPPQDVGDVTLAVVDGAPAIEGVTVR